MVSAPPLLVLVGPTAVGKTAVAVRLAAHVPIEVVSADSRQVYRGMDIGTGKPTAAERGAVPHHLLDVAGPDERYHVARFRADALATIAPVQAVCGNVDPIDGRLPDELALVAGGLSIHVSHGHELGSPTPARLLSSYSADILIYGHTHKALVERDGLRLVINPGAAGPRRFDLHPSVARLTIAGGRADVELVTLSA